MIRSVSTRTLTIILSYHPCFDGNTVLNDVAESITYLAMVLRLNDIWFLMIPAFRKWEKSTTFWPKSTMKPYYNYLVPPVKECTKYRDRFYSRDRFCIGVTFATFVPIGNRYVGVVWTTSRKAYMFEYLYLKGWVLFKTLNRQDDPFRTWLKHLGGNEKVCNEKTGDDRFSSRHAELLFHDLMVPYFGTHPYARTRMREIVHDSPVWELVKRVSYMVVPEDDARRFSWKPI